MATLAEQLRGELSKEFAKISDQLDADVCRQIMIWGEAYVKHTSRNDIDFAMDGSQPCLGERLFDAARQHYTEQGLKFRIDYSPMGTIKRGFFVSL